MASEVTKMTTYTGLLTIAARSSIGPLPSCFYATNLCQFRHRRATKRNLFRRQLQKSEYLWGITRTAEAGLESCGQLILQVLLREKPEGIIGGASFSCSIPSQLWLYYA